jgi:hypothetical protein
MYSPVFLFYFVINRDSKSGQPFSGLIEPPRLKDTKLFLLLRAEGPKKTLCPSCLGGPISVFLSLCGENQVSGQRNFPIKRQIFSHYRLVRRRYPKAFIS